MGPRVPGGPSISKRDGGLVGHAKDPISSGRALQSIVGPRYWRDDPSAEVLCLGAGGSGAAVVAHLVSQADRPARIVMTNRSSERLDAIGAMLADLGAHEAVERHVVRDAAATDALVGGMSPGSLVINATGLGKDRPGSPMSDMAVLPADSFAWDFNYRGDLLFLRQARRQLPASRVHDGWRYFLHGWTQVIAEVFALDMSVERFERLEDAAEPFRPHEWMA